ncbi:MAG TPA: hypothetical protein PLD84_08125, partial [Chitinophagales bacterium]|nr:hypothetical protein [Chitinophagales bacterium]
ENGAATVDENHIAEVAGVTLAPFEREKGDNPYDVQYALQEMMQQLVGIVRTEDEMLRAVEHLKLMRQRADGVRVTGNREYNNGWHTALDLQNLLTVSEAITLSALERKESRGAHFRDDYPSKDDKSGKFNLVIKKDDDGQMQIRQEIRKELRQDLQQIIEEMK